MTSSDAAPPASVSPIADALHRQGWSEATDLFDPKLLQDLRDEVTAHRDAGDLNPARTGRGAGRRAGTLRGDSTLWLDDAACGVAAARFLSALDALRIALNRELMLGLHEVEAHYAIYPPGAGYSRHRDRFRDDDARVVSLVCYLNAGWPADAGGHLRLHLADGPHDIAPALGTTVMFLSGEIEHEVLPALRERISIAAWFRRRSMVPG
jgi:SM-20-related protein